MTFVLQDSYTVTPNDYDTGNWGTKYAGVNIVAGSSYTITAMNFWLRRVGSPGTLTLHIKAVDANDRPTGGDLATGTIDGDGLTTSGTGAEAQITLGAGTALTSGVKYACYLSGGVDVSNQYNIFTKDVASGGTRIQFNGTTWYNCKVSSGYCLEQVWFKTFSTATVNSGFFNFF